MKLNNFKLGVLGGIGPEATAHFYTKLIEDFQIDYKPHKNTEFPQIIINSIPAPELLYSGSIKDNDIVYYKNGIRDLNKHNPDFIIMVCNTIYLFYEELQRNSRAKILDIRKSVLEKIKCLPRTRVIVLGTPNTINKKLYFVEGRDYTDLSDKDVSSISELIKKYNLGINKELQINLFNKILLKNVKDGNIIILGCTELSLMNRTKSSSIIDTLDIMVEETLKLLLRQKNKNGNHKSSSS